MIEVVAVDDDARRSLWSYLAGIDLFPTVEWWNAPVDYPLATEVDFDRRITRKPGDSLWINLLDIPAALMARTYETDGEITLGVTDGFLDRAGTYRLTVEGGSATCEPSDDEPDVVLAVRDLSALYLGLPSAVTRWRAGRIEGSHESILDLDRILRTAAAPFCNEVF